MRRSARRTSEPPGAADREVSQVSIQIEHLTERRPQVSADELLSAFRPSERFGEVSFDTYRPDPQQPSQAEAVREL